MTPNYKIWTIFPIKKYQTHKFLEITKEALTEITLTEEL